MFSSALRSFSSNISSSYKLSDNVSSVSGPWKIFDATSKSSGKVVSVFIFDKKSLDANTNSSGFGSRSSAGTLKRAHEEIVERLKKEASSLAKLRHPSILELVEPVEETRSGGLMFATEHVTASLSGLLLEKDDQERAGGVGGRSSRFVVDDADGRGKRRRELEIDELEIQKGLVQVGKGLEFLHESAGLVHANLTPDAIFINAKSDWKISGLGFSGKSDGTTVATSALPIPLSEVLNFDPRLPRSVQLNLDYCSPDFVMDNNVSPAADMFSLGLLIIALYNSPHRSPLETNMSISTYKKLFASSSSIPNQNNNFMSSAPLAKAVTNLLPRLITRRPAQRLGAREFQQAEYFDNILVSTIRFLESLPAKTPAEKSQFLRGLPRIINQFPKSVLEKKVLPALLEEMKDRELISLILQNAFKMLKIMPSAQRAFSERVIPKIREVFIPAVTSTGKGQTPAAADRDGAKEAGIMVLLENMQAVAENTTGKEFKDDILPIIHLAMESPTHSVVDASLGTLPVILSVLDFSTIKNEVFPVISNVFGKTSSMGIKIRGLEALQTLCGGTPGQASSDDDDGLSGFDDTTAKKRKKNSVILDKYTIQEKVVPLMKAIRTKEPAVMMTALDVFREIGKIADSDFLAMEVLPILWSFSLGPLLNLQQFQSFMATIRILSTRIEQEQTRKLQELSASNPAVANRNDFMSFGPVSGRSNGIDDAANGDHTDFESLVYGHKVASSPSGLDSFDAWSTQDSMASRTVPLRPQPKQATSPLPPAFSWSTSTQVNPSINNITSNSSAGAMTANHALNAFAALQPQPLTPISSLSTPLQPLQPSSILQPSQPSQLSASRPVDWSTAGNSNWSSSGTTSTLSNTNLWSSSSNMAQSQPQLTPSSNPWTSSNPNQQQGSMSYSSFGMQSTQLSKSAFTIAPPPAASPYSGFAIPPPPAPNSMAQNRLGSSSTMATLSNLGNAQKQNQQSNNNGQKQGLEKYESLL